MTDTNKRLNVVNERAFEYIDEYPVPEFIVVHSKEELFARLDEAHKDYEEGRTIDAYEMLKRMSEKYGI